MTTTKYPLPAFYFNVSWEDGITVPFSEVSGLNVEIEPIEYRDGESKEFSTIKMPGLKKYGPISLKRGAIIDGNTLFDWWNSAQLNVPDRKSVTISLLNEKHIPVITWKIKNAFPIKLDSGALNAKTNEVLIETLDLAHEGITIEQAKP
jgi:phage tail-like protein